MRNGIEDFKFFSRFSNEEKELLRNNNRETTWMRLDLLNQEILDDITSIYCQVYSLDPEMLDNSPQLAEVKDEILNSPGFYERKIANNKEGKPLLEIRRIEQDKNRSSGMLVRFRTSAHPKRIGFQEAVDEYLCTFAKAQPLSKFLRNY